MIVFSKFGKQEIQRHSLMPLVTAKLFVGEGEELAGNGYAAIPLVPDNWNLDTGAYPTLEWIFKADIPAEVEGYYIVNAADEIVLYEEFDEHQTIQHTGDKIAVSITLAPVVKNGVKK
jgi:hypothetical protein